MTTTHRSLAAAAALAVTSLVWAGAASGARASDPVTCDGLTPTIVGTDRNDHLVGTDGPDVIVGLDGVDTIEGLGGDDVLCGGPGWDRLDGGPGDDVLRGQGTSWDVLRGGEGDDQLWLRARDSADYSDAPGPIHAYLATGTVTGWGTDTVHHRTPGAELLGSAYDDRITGTPGHDRLFGGGGNDLILGGAGHDYLSAYGAGASVLRGQDGNDRLEVMDRDPDHGPTSAYGGAGNDAFRVYPKAGDVFEAGPGRDAVMVEWQVQTVPDVDIDGGGDAGDTLTLRTWASTTSSFGPAQVDLAAGTVSIAGQTLPFRGFAGFAAGPRAFVDSWDAAGTSSDDTFVFRGNALYGNGPVTVHAFGGDDRVFTGPGDDTVYGGSGHDLAHTGDGTDTCSSVEDTADCEAVEP